MTVANILTIATFLFGLLSAISTIWPLTLRLAKANASQSILNIKGWLLDIRCLSSESTKMNRIPLYVFPSALEDDYTPRKGNLIQGNIWLSSALQLRTYPTA